MFKLNNLDYEWLIYLVDRKIDELESDMIRCADNGQVIMEQVIDGKLQELNFTLDKLEVLKEDLQYETT